MASDPSSDRIDQRFALRVLGRAALFFLILNLLFAMADPLPAIGRVTLYNHVLPGRLRLPYGDDPQKSYSVSIPFLAPLMASHLLSAGPKPDDEFRVLVLGDSSIWGFLLDSSQTVTAQLNAQGYQTKTGSPLRFYNLGYPTLSLLKDLMILGEAERHEPDLIVWFVTLESFLYSRQLDSPVVQQNPEIAREWIARYRLPIDPADPRFVEPAWAQRTIIGRRKALADLFRLQLYGVMWAAAAIDHDLNQAYEPAQMDLAAEVSFHDYAPGQLAEGDLAFELLAAAIASAPDVPMIFVNDPILISRGRNSDLRYNFYYPRWAYDEYRVLFAELAANKGWAFLDMWDLLRPEAFTNTAIHYDAPSARQVALRLGPSILREVDRAAALDRPAGSP